MNYFQNISTNYNQLSQDFVGYSITISGIVNFFQHIVIAVIIFFIFYFLGKKINNLFFKVNKKYTFFVNIVLGYIVIGTTIGLLGVFSLLQKNVLWLYLFSLLFFAFYPFRFDFRMLRVLFQKQLRTLASFKRDLVVWGVILFVFIAFLRLMTPEITEDAYHTDLPRLYLATETTMHQTFDPLHVIPYPQLAEMIYLIPIFLGDKEATRFIHFGFYLLIIFLFFSITKKKELSFVKFAPILFVTAPIMIRYSPTQYVDFFMVFSFLLSIILIQKNMSKKQLVLIGIIFGSVLSVKMWTFVYIPAVLAYILIIERKESMADLLKKSIVFLLAVFIVPLIWYIRSFLITGNPIYPIFSKFDHLETNIISSPIDYHYFGFNSGMFSYDNLAVYSPLFFMGIIIFLFSFKKTFVLLKRFPFALFFVLLMFEQLIIKIDLGRYLVAWYTTSSIIVAAAIFSVYRHIGIRLLLISLFLVLFTYYFLNTLFTLPYGFGWADQNAYLTRVLGRDNASYYDFDRLFAKWISKDDLVASYGIYGYYYANFSFIDVNYIFSKENRSFDLVKEKKVTRLLIKGGDFKWFCEQLHLTDCKPEKVKLLATYPADLKKYNLYLLQY